MWQYKRSPKVLWIEQCPASTEPGKNENSLYALEPYFQMTNLGGVFSSWGSSKNWANQSEEQMGRMGRMQGRKKTSSVVSAQFVSVWLLHAQKHSYSYSLHFSQKSASKCCLYSVSNSSSQQTCWKSKDSRNSALLRKILIQLNLAAQISYITCELEDSLIIWEHWFVLLKTLNKSGNFP